MKKLMTMIAAVATAFGLYAADTGTSFEGGTVGETLKSQAASITELSAITGGAWEGDDTNATIRLLNGGLGDNYRPTQFTLRGDPDERYLELSTGSAVLWRKVGFTTDLMANNLYLDTTVKMTVFDSDPEIDSSAKVAVWLQEADFDANENPTATNLMVRANGRTYNCGPREDLAETWTRLTIKAIKAKAGQIGFVIYEGGSNKATSQKTPIAWTDDVTIDTTGFEPAAKKYGDDKQLFLAASGTTVSSVGFSGKGGVDDIVFTETNPAFAPDWTFYTVAGNDNIVSFKIDDATWTKGGNALQFPFTGAASVSVTDIEADEGFFPESKSVTLNVEAAIPYKVGTAKAKNFTVTVDGEEVPCATFAAAVTAANGAKVSGATIKLEQACDASSDAINNASFATVLDLAGYTLTGTVTYQTALKVMDSSDTNAGKIVPAAEANAIQFYDDKAETGPVLTIEGGTIDGPIYFAGMSADTIVVKGGVFYSDDSEVFPYAETNPWMVGADTYKATWAANYWTVVPVTKYTVTFVDEEGVALDDPQTVVEGELATRPADPKKDHFKFDNWYRNDVEFDFTTPIMANTELVGKFTEDDKFMVTVTNEGNVKDIKVNDVAYIAPVTFYVDTVVTVTATAKEGYKNVKFAIDGAAAADTCTFTLADNTTVAITVEADAKDPADDEPGDIPPGQTAGDRYGSRVPTALAGVSAKALCTWAKGVGALTTGENIEVKAYLFNIANASNETAVKAEEAHFAFTSFSADAAPETGKDIPDTNVAGVAYNGEIVITEHADPACKTDYVSGEQKFYKATLQPRNVVK